ncbi:MAG: acetyl-CoA carboxylase biotin carboxyl carrier protein [Bacteroidia bacterium]|nr:acetyl-CoA carboxylase biotin carboxyl carrier protein [Bacteroidia bacterium]
MDLKEIQDLIKFVAKSGVNEVELETDGVKIVIKTGATKIETIAVQAPAPVIAAAPVAAAPAVAAPAQAAATPAAAPAADTSKYVEIKSPMVGTFYRRPSPDKDLFVNIGDDIKKGDVVCMIEAMKLFNEIESEINGRIVKVLVDDATPVEYDQPLFLVEPA